MGKTRAIQQGAACRNQYTEFTDLQGKFRVAFTQFHCTQILTIYTFNRAFPDFEGLRNAVQLPGFHSKEAMQFEAY